MPVQRARSDTKGGESGGGDGSSVTDPVGQGATPGVTRGKYLLLEVPNWNDSETQPMNSYLRIGAVKDVSVAGLADAPKETGEDLAAYVQGFIDDTRARGGCDSTGEFTFTSQDTHAKESAILHTKGGWRDHSDGNRISTTRGDKVEVIRGNYKRIVLGRTDREDDAAVLDVSGGHAGDSPITFRPGYENKIEWVQNYDGTWKVTESTVRGDVTSTYHGDTVDFFYGNIKSSTTGSAAPSKYHENPTITDRTWAVAISSYTGSAALPVPSISDETWATQMTSVTNAVNMTSTTTATAIEDVTTSGTIASVTTAGLITDLTTVGLSSSTTIGNSETLVVGNELTTNVGTVTEIVVGSMNDITIGTTTSLTVGLSLDVQIAAFLSLALSGGIDIAVGPRLDIGVFQLSWNPLCMDIEELKTKLVGAEAKAAGTITYKAGMIFIG
ncbi:MAG: hypothetical protein U0271_08975 [Polyangiaceae bacterium]